jgi:hypothetical protein
MRPKRGARGCGPSPTGLLRRCRRCGPHRRAVTIRAGTVQSELAEGEQLGPSFHLGDPHHQHRYLQRDPPTAQEESLRERSSDGFQRSPDSDTQIYLRSSPRRNFVQKISRFLCCQIDRRRPYRTATKFWRMRLSSRKYRVLARETLPELAKIVAEASPRGFIESSPASSSPPSEGLGPRTCGPCGRDPIVYQPTSVG